MLFRLRVNTSFRPSTSTHACKPARSQSYDFLARAYQSPAYSRHPALRLTPADSKQAQHTYVHTSCLADRVSMTQVSNASFTSEVHLYRFHPQSSDLRANERLLGYLSSSPGRISYLHLQLASIRTGIRRCLPDVSSISCFWSSIGAVSLLILSLVWRCAPSSGIPHHDVMYRSPSRTSNAMQPSKLSIYISTLPLDIYSR